MTMHSQDPGHNANDIIRTFGINDCCIVCRIIRFPGLIGDGDTAWNTGRNFGTAFLCFQMPDHFFGGTFGYTGTPVHAFQQHSAVLNRGHVGAGTGPQAAVIAAGGKAVYLFGAVISIGFAPFINVGFADALHNCVERIVAADRDHAADRTADGRFPDFSLVDLFVGGTHGIQLDQAGCIDFLVVDADGLVRIQIFHIDRPGTGVALDGRTELFFQRGERLLFTGVVNAVLIQIFAIDPVIAGHDSGACEVMLSSINGFPAGGHDTRFRIEIVVFGAFFIPACAHDTFGSEAVFLLFDRFEAGGGMTIGIKIIPFLFNGNVIKLGRACQRIPCIK